MNFIRLVIVSAVVMMSFGNFAVAKESINDRAMTEAMEYVTSTKSITTMSSWLAKKVDNGLVTFNTMQAPNVVFLGQQELNEQFLNEEAKKFVKNLRAVYDDHTGTIYLLNT
ncbi:hypothetical protein LCGC14_2168440, partial [marine sediment metagenome]